MGTGTRKLEFDDLENFNSAVNVDNSTLAEGRDLDQDSLSFLIGVQAGL